MKPFHLLTTALTAGCLLDHGCLATVSAIVSLFKERGVEIDDVSSLLGRDDLSPAPLHSRPSVFSQVEACAHVDGLAGSDVTCKRTHLRHVLLNVCKDKWVVRIAVLRQCRYGAIAHPTIPPLCRLSRALHRPSGTSSRSTRLAPY